MMKENQFTPARKSNPLFNGKVYERRRNRGGLGVSNAGSGGEVEVTIKAKIEGFLCKIISNTTISRPDPVKSLPAAEESGGLSGKPLFDLSTNILKDMYILTRGKTPLIGCGGISSGEDAYKKIRAGATLVQLYTGFAYGGPALIPQIKAELAECLERDGFKSISEAVGADCR